MKDYTIWLRGGGAISGTINDAEEKSLLRKKAFTDTDGKMFVRRKEIAAIAVCAKTESRKAGF